MSEPWTIARVLGWAQKDLAGRSSSSPRLDAELMLAQVLDCDRVKLIVDATRPLSPEELAAYKALHKRRRVGEPIAYLRGYREFYSRRFQVDARVLVPRPETELLVETGLHRTRHLDLSARVLDLCTGSGCVAITLERERPTTSVLGSDISSAALAVARDNAHRLGARVGFFESDLFAAFPEGRWVFDLITANPPYVPEADMAELPVDVRDFEPRLALAAGADGLTVIRPLVEQAVARLAPGGVLALEVVAGGAPAVAALLASHGYQAVEIKRDYGGHERIVSALRPAT
ncbi:MAG: peptide chain release factor N(5)-glutamine methyltransferase [Myxococcales bacterium]|nr:peptide chain release factor N(5)-glutamine methyltransferase [Myxococcales bacterium]